MQTRIRFDSTVRNCFVDVSDRIVDTLGLRFSGEVLTASKEMKKVYLTWSGRRCSTSIRIGKDFAECLGMRDGDVVSVSKCKSVVEAKNVEVEPVSSDDWEMIELNGGHLEQNLLGQIAAVWSDAVFPIWIRNALVRVRVKTNSGDKVLRLTRNVTQLLVVPKPREKIEDVKGGEEEDQKDPIVNARVTVHRVLFDSQRIIRISPCVADAMNLKHHEISNVVVALWPRRRRKKRKQGEEEEEDEDQRKTIDFMRVSIDSRLRYMHVSVPTHVRNDLHIAMYSTVCLRRVRREADVVEVRSVRCFSSTITTTTTTTRIDVEELKKGIETSWKDSVVVTTRSKSLHKWILGENEDEKVEEKVEEEEEETLPYGGNIQEAMRAQDRDAIRVLLKARNRLSGVSSSTSHASNNSNKKEKQEIYVEIQWSINSNEKSKYNTSSRNELSKLLSFVNLNLKRALEALRIFLRKRKVESLSVLQINTPEKNMNNNYWTYLPASLSPTRCQEPKNVFHLGLNDTVKSAQCHLAGTLVGKFAAQRVMRKLPSSGGIYVHGKSGIGKTTFVRSFARHMQLEHDCSIVWIQCEELQDRVPNELSSILKRAFRVARRSAPSIIVLDDLDKLAPHDDSSGGDSASLGGNMNILLAKHCVETLSDLAVSQQIASDAHMFRISSQNNSSCPQKQLLEMEAIRTGVSMIATGANTKSISSALRRGGVLDLALELPDPGPERREIIIRELLRSRGEGGHTDITDEAIKFMAHETDSYTASDLSLLLERIVHVSCAFKATRENILMKKEHVKTALDGFVPVALRGLKLVQSKTSWDDVGGLEDVCRTLRDTLELPLRFPDFFRNAPIRLPAGVLLYGPPGCGKTLVAGAAAGQCGLNFLSVKGPELLDKYIGASEAAVRALFARAQAASPCVLFFDEFEATAPKRGSDGTGVTDRVVNQLLTFLDGVEDRSGVYVLAATSRPDMIDAALLRPGRLDTAVECGFPNKEDRVKILNVASRGYDVSSESSKLLKDVMMSRRTEGWSGADIKALLTTAHLTALRRNSRSIDLDDIEHALNDVRPSVPLEERARYARIYGRFKGSRAADFPMTEVGGEDEGGLKQRTALK